MTSHLHFVADSVLTSCFQKNYSCWNCIRDIKKGSKESTLSNSENSESFCPYKLSQFARTPFDKRLLQHQQSYVRLIFQGKVSWAEKSSGQEKFLGKVSHEERSFPDWKVCSEFVTNHIECKRRKRFPEPAKMEWMDGWMEYSWILRKIHPLREGKRF